MISGMGGKGTGRNTRDGARGRQIARDDRAGADNSVLADYNARQHDRPGSDENAMAQNDATAEGGQGGDVDEFAHRAVVVDHGTMIDDRAATNPSAGSDEGPSRQKTAVPDNRAGGHNRGGVIDRYWFAAHGQHALETPSARIVAADGDMEPARHPAFAPF